MINQRSGTYATFPPVVPLAPGSDTHGFGIGIMYLFDVTVGFGGGKPPEVVTPAAPPAAAPSEKPAATPPTAPAAEPAEQPPAPEPAAP
jgi:hypothetical protein